MCLHGLLHLSPLVYMWPLITANREGKEFFFKIQKLKNRWDPEMYYHPWRHDWKLFVKVNTLIYLYFYVILFILFLFLGWYEVMGSISSCRKLLWLLLKYMNDCEGGWTSEEVNVYDNQYWSPGGTGKVTWFKFTAGSQALIRLILSCCCHFFPFSLEGFE